MLYTNVGGIFMPFSRPWEVYRMSQLMKRLRTLTALVAALALLACAVPAAVTASGSEETVETRETVSSYPYTTVTKVKVNLRAERSTRSALLRKIPAGAEIIVNGVKGTWAEVDYGKYSGYVKTDYIELKEVKPVKVTPTPTPVPTLSPEEDAGGYQILQKGDSGDAVIALQEAMIELGFLSGTADGKFGAGTERAVISFQVKNEYPATGIMDANIQAFLFSGQVKNAKGEKTTVKTLSPVEDVSMKKGNTGTAVRKLQERLAELGYLKARITAVYDTNTIGAVRSFQKKNGLPADGTADVKTRKAIYSEDAINASATATPNVTAAPTPTPAPEVPTKTLKSGDEGPEVKTLQARLKELGYYRSNIDGKMGRMTVNALIAFQEAHGLKGDGVAGKETYDILFSDRALPSGTTPTPEPTATPAPETTDTPAPAWPTLRKGDSGTAVAQLQEALIQLDYLAGKADGNYGDKTVEAVKAFQRNNGLTVDGTAGEQTQKVLYSGSAKPAPKDTPTPKPSASPTPTPASNVLKIGSKGSAVKSLQSKLNQLGYAAGKADGVFGLKTAGAVKSFQKDKRLVADGVAGEKTLKALEEASSGNQNPAATATPAPTAAPVVTKPSASRVLYANWYEKVKAVAKKYPYATVYDFATGISWQIHIFSVGAHADYEPVTASDTAKLEKVFGGNTWNPRAVWVIFSDGSVYIGSTHSMPHEVQHIRDNNFPGHSCLHFPRTQEQVQAIGPYATSHQEKIDAGWAQTQAMK